MPRCWRCWRSMAQTSRPHAAALLWPDADSQRARNNLRQRLFRLRRAAGRDVIDERTALALAAGVVHDLASLPAQLAQDPGAAAGELLGSFGYEDSTELDDWVRAARERFRAQRRDSLAAAAADEESAGHIARALIFAERLVNDEPLSEQAHRLLMRLHYRRGDRSSALAAYARCEQCLHRELGRGAGRRDARTGGVDRARRRATGRGGAPDADGTGPAAGAGRPRTPVAHARGGVAAAQRRRADRRRRHGQDAAARRLRPPSRRAAGRCPSGRRARALCAAGAVAAGAARARLCALPPPRSTARCAPNSPACCPSWARRRRRR